ncbi:hypothetical protein QYM36_015676 [Artemia franciscana]|uniref:DNA topoisomerase n=1 Tax=Artemia franciscana TaxID=6661 RepID=A0AA88HM49_ARTSF|nr:hypothetical protein QYM36_015676 [Artemia franciscana]
MLACLIRKFCTRQEMVRVLNVAEKNDAAKNISDLLSRGNYNRKEGRSKFNKIYEFSFELLNQKCSMAMTSVSGHLLGYEFQSSFKYWESVNPVTLFEAPVTKQCQDKFKDIKQTLEQEARRAQWLVIWTDCDREGENIGFEIVEVCLSVSPRLKVYRARFSEITHRSLINACQNLGPIDKRVSDAVDVRSELDLRIGAAFTRFQTLRLKRVFPSVITDGKIISYGSCQFPTLGFVVERFKSIESFIPEAFWKIRVIHEIDESERAEFIWTRNRLFNELACQVIHDHCVDAGTAIVTKIETKPKSKWRPLPLDTVEMEKLGSRKLRLNAKEVMKIAEKLYVQGYISYPRTETNIFPKELDLTPLIQCQTSDSRWGAFASNILNSGPTPRQGKKSDQAHPPIHPTKYANSLQGNEAKLYEFIVRHFLACCSKDAQGLETKVDIKIGDEQFVATGLMITARNYLEVYPYDRWSDKSLPIYTEGQVFTPTRIDLDESATTAPPLLTEADLIGLMEKHGIGTDATHAEHIETIKSRDYVGVQTDGRFVPCPLGIGLVEGYDAMGFAMSKPHLRAELEADLKRICDGTKDPSIVLREQVAKYKEVFIKAVEQVDKIDDAISLYLQQPKVAVQPSAMALPSALPKVQKCPNCQGDLTLKRKRDASGYYVGCNNYPTCKAAIWLPSRVNEVEVDSEKCQTCQGSPYKLKFKFNPGAYRPHLDDTVVVCIGGCDDFITNLLGIKPLRPANSSRPPDRGLPQSPTTVSEADRSFQQTRHSFVRTGSFQSYSGSNRSDQELDADWGDDLDDDILIMAGNIDVAPLSSGNNSATMPTGRTLSTAVAGSNDVLCTCRTQALLLTVRKEGPNKGRQFYKCGNQTTDCRFFLWSDEIGNAQVPSQTGRPPQAQNQAVGVANCHCGIQAKMKVGSLLKPVHLIVTFPITPYISYSQNQIY